MRCGRCEVTDERVAESTNVAPRVMARPRSHFGDALRGVC